MNYRVLAGRACTATWVRAR